MVALRKESVDRNLHSRNGHNVNREVALRKESVDRNYQANAVDQILPVALRKESVDRNYQVCQFTCRGWRRSPQGERG